MDSSEKSVNDLAKLLELEFLQNSELPNQESDQNSTEVVSFKSVHPLINSANSNLTASSTSSLPKSDSVLKPDPKTNSVAKLATTGQLSSAVGESAMAGPLSSTVAELTTIGHLSSDSDDEEEKTNSPSASVLHTNKTSNCLHETKFPTLNKSGDEKEFKMSPQLKPSISVRSVNKSSQIKHKMELSMFGNLSSESDEEEFKTSAQLKPLFSESVADNSKGSQLEASNNSLKSLAKEFQLKSPKLCTPEHSINRSSNSSPLSEDKVCKVNGQMFKVRSSGNLVESVVLNKQDPETNDGTDPLKSNTEMPNSFEQSKAAKNNGEPVKHVINPGKNLTQKQMTSFKLDMVNLFGNEYLSSSSDEENASKHPTPSDKIKSSTSVEKYPRNLTQESKTIENSSSNGNECQNPISIINCNSEKSFEKNDEKSISFPKELSEVNSSLNSKGTKKISVDKESSLLFEPNSYSSNSGGCKTAKMLQTNLKNVPEINPCMEDPKNVDQNSLKTDPANLKEFCLSNASSMDVSLKCTDAKVNPEIVSSKSGSPESEKQIESVRIVKDSPEKINKDTNVKKCDQESAIVEENHSETSTNDKCSLPEALEHPLVTNSRENKEMSLNSLSENLMELEPPCLESTKNYSIDRKILKITMTGKNDSFENNPNLASVKEKDQSDKSKSLLEDQSIKKEIKLSTVEELSASSSEKNWLTNKDCDDQTVGQFNVNVEDPIIKGSPENVVDFVDAGSSLTKEVQMESKKANEVLELLENVNNAENVSSHLFSTESQSQPEENPSEISIPLNVKNSCAMSPPEMASSKEFSVNNSSSKSAVVEKMQPNLSEPISQSPNKCTHILTDTFQTTSPSVPLQITNLPGEDKSVDDTIIPKSTEKLISSLENNSLAKKPNVLSEADINKSDHSFQPVSGEKGSHDPDGLFDAADSLLRLSGHGIINGSSSSDKENELENISDKLIPSETDLKKVNKTDNVPSSVDGLHFFQYNSAEDSQHIKTGKNSNHSRSLSECCKDAESLTNGTENIPKRLNNDSSLFFENGNLELLKNGSKENCKNLWNFNNLLQDTENSENLKISIKEIGGRLNSSGNPETLGNGLDNIKRLKCFHKSSENIEKSASIETDSIENRKEQRIDNRSTESNIDSEKNCIDDKRLKDFNHLSENDIESGSLRNDVEEKNIKDSRNLSKSLQDFELLRNNTGEGNGKKLCSPNITVGIIEASKCLQNGMRENSEKIHNSNGLHEDNGNPDHPTKTGGRSMNNELPFVEVSLASEDVSSTVHVEKSNNVNLCDNLLTKENSISDGQNSSNVEEMLQTNIKSQNENDVCNDLLKHSVTGDLSSMEEFSDLESTELMPMANRNFVSNINMNELFGDDDDDDQLNSKSEKMVTVTEPKNFTASLSNDSVSRVDNCDSSVGSKNQNSLPLFVNKVSVEKKNLQSALGDMHEQSQSNGFGTLKSRIKRKPACKMAAAPTRLPKSSMKSIDDNDKLGKATTEKAVINSKYLIKFVASSEKLFLPNRLVDPVSHDNSPPSMKKIKKDEDPVEPTSILKNCLHSSKTITETNCLQIQNDICSQQLFARKSKGDNSGDICEQIKEFILVTGPVSPLAATPEEKSISQFPNASPPPSKEQINVNTSTPTSTCDYFQDIKPLLNMIPQISPIVTPKKLRERKSKKSLLKAFVSDDTTKSDIVNAARPLSQTLAVDIDSGNGENKTSLFLQSDSLTQSKLTATEANHTMQVDASQPSADKKCLNSQQRLLRKSR